MKFALLSKENQILRRALKKREITAAFNNSDRLFYLKLLQMNKKLKRYITLVQPSTVLKKWKYLCKSRWKYHHSSMKKGRHPITQKIRKLILEIKKINYS